MQQRLSRRAASAALVGLLCVVAPACSGHAPSGHTALARVVRVVDGDTIVVRMEGRSSGRTETVRLIGVDTPETVKPNSPVECYGPEASALTHRLLPEGTRVRLSRDAEARDDYGRLLAYVHRVVDDLFVNLELVAAGAARPLTIAPNTVATAEIVAAAERAANDGLGLWAACSG